MTDTELKEFLDELIPDYAAGHVEAGDWDPDQATDIATKQVYGLVPEGVRTPSMLLYIAETLNAERVGRVWIGLNHKLPGCAYIYYIEIDAERRGEGYGRALLNAVEEQARRHGARTMGLHVFGTNKVARALYESVGYEVTQLDMRKNLAASSGDHT
jgi:ribosomal protein S18 acetylase RimI-like enzyme